MIKIGDRVIYQRPSYRNPDGTGFMPMGLADCKVVGLTRGEMYDDLHKETRPEEDLAELEWTGLHTQQTSTFHAPLAWCTKQED